MRIVSIQYGELPYFAAATKILEMYCDKYGYELVIVGSEHRSDRSPMWSKIPAVLNAMRGTDFVFYVDADATIVDHSIPLEAFLPMLPPNKVMLVGEDFNRGVANTGAWLLQSCEESIKLLQRWDETSSFAKYAWDYPVDEAAFNHIILKEYADLIELPRRAQLNWVAGGFISHYMGGHVAKKTRLIEAALFKLQSLRAR